MRSITFILKVYLFVCLSVLANANDDGVCLTKDQESDTAEIIFCKSFDGNESACRINNSDCRWKNNFSKSCEPKNSDKFEDATQCKSFHENEKSCKANTKCKWVDAENG